MLKFLVSDPGGLFCEHASGLTRGGNKVKYWTQFNYKYRDYAIGFGYGGLEKIMYFAEHIDWADCIVGFDVRGQDMIGWLRDKYPKKSIFGSGWGGKLEDDRIALKEFTRSFGLPVQNYSHVKGITRLKEYLKEHKNVYVKTNIFREDCESFFSKDYATVESELDQLADHLGAHKEIYDFIVEDSIDTDIEIGFDGFFNGTDYAKPFLLGYELHKNLYIGKTTDTLPQAIEETMTAFRPLLSKLDYRGALSTEEKIISQEEHYLLDFCARLAHPFTAGYTEWIRNWPEFVYGIGKGEKVTPEFRSKYVGAFTLKSQKALDMYLKVNRKNKSKVKLVLAMGNDAGDFAVRGEDHVAVLIAEGGSVDDVLRQIQENSKSVDVNGLDYDPLKGIDSIKDVIEKGRKIGLEF